MAINGANSWGRQSMDVQYALQLVETRTEEKRAVPVPDQSHSSRLRNGVSCAPTPLAGKVVASQGTSDAACRGPDATRLSGRRLNRCDTPRRSISAETSAPKITPPLVRIPGPDDASPILGEHRSVPAARHSCSI